MPSSCAMKTDVDRGVDENNYEDWLAARGETAGLEKRPAEEGRLPHRSIRRNATLATSRRGPSRSSACSAESQRGLV